jgi:hypothetical protein
VVNPARLKDFAGSQPSRHKTDKVDALQALRQQEGNRHSSGVSVPAVIEGLQQHIAFPDRQINQLKRHYPSPSA